MPNPKNFATQIFQKPVSSRSLTDPVPEEEETLEEVDVPTAQDMIDSLYRIMMERFDKIEELLKKDCQCQKK
jgi:hypothetical protein